MKVYEQHNLPRIGSFFGRERELNELQNRILSNTARVININGPPGFGKSKLAVQLGHELVKHHSDVISKVLYIDTERARKSKYLCSPSEFMQKEKFIPMPGMHPLFSDLLKADVSNTQLEFKTLCDWSIRLTHRVVLILDNCDHILHGRDRKRFLDMIQWHFPISKINLVVTSQERLFFLDVGYFSATLRKLSLKDSRAMLQHYVPLTADEADALATVAGHCPLALLVAAKLLSVRGLSHLESLIHQFEERVVDTLSDPVSRNSEKFNVIMDKAYNQMNDQTQNVHVI